jgi:alkanesulfonate monooxygenase SsuD/methylene tetrahydromethanopterin reductase-like flavin-dependent oxidoreductase (luciferase family)
MAAATGRTPEEASRSLLIGGVDEIKLRVQEYVDAGVQEFMLALWPRFYREPVLRFSEEVIPVFR